MVTKKVSVTLFSLLSILWLSIMPSIQAGLTVINSQAINTFLESNVPEISDIWENTIVSIDTEYYNAVKKLDDYNQELIQAFKGDSIGTLNTNIQNAFTSKIKEYAKKEILQALSLEQIKQKLTSCLKNLDLSQPSEFKNFATLIALEAKEPEIEKLTGITTLSQLIAAIGSAVCAYYKPENLCYRLHNNDTAITSQPLTPILIEKEENGTITVISIPRYNQDKFHRALNALEEKQPSTFIKILGLICAFSQLASPFLNTYQQYHHAKQPTTTNICPSVLPITPGMTPQEITKMYKKQILLIHPDKCPTKECAEKAAILNHCYEQTKKK